LKCPRDRNGLGHNYHNKIKKRSPMWGISVWGQKVREVRLAHTRELSLEKSFT